MVTSSSIFRQGLVGGLAGFIATVPMTAAMKKMKDMLPWWQKWPLPPSQVTYEVEKVIGIDDQISDTQHHAATAVAHFGYGAAAAMPFAALSHRLPIPSALSGLVYGLIVWASSYVGWLPVVGVMEPVTKHPWQRNALMITAHVVWGTTMGLFFGALRGRRHRVKRH